MDIDGLLFLGKPEDYAINILREHHSYFMLESHGDSFDYIYWDKYKFVFINRICTKVTLK